MSRDSGRGRRVPSPVNVPSLADLAVQEWSHEAHVMSPSLAVTEKICWEHRYNGLQKHSSLDSAVALAIKSFAMMRLRLASESYQSDEHTTLPNVVPQVCQTPQMALPRHYTEFLIKRELLCEVLRLGTDGEN